MCWLRFLTSSVGKKIVMAVTGFLLFGFLIIHMLGNWQIFPFMGGAEALNAYAKFLKHNPLVLWGFRFGLLAIAVIHAWTAIQLTLENRASRPEGYSDPKPLGASLASLTMAVSGLIVLAFIVYHILHFTLHVVPSDVLVQLDSEKRMDVFNMVVKAFQNPLISIFYVVSVGCLCYHLSHGLQSMFRSIGLSNRGYMCLQQLFAWGASVVIFVGMAAVPLSVLFGYVK